MDSETRAAIERATQHARRLLEGDFAAQLEGDFDILRDGTIAPKPGPQLTAAQVHARARITAAIDHKRAAGMGKVDSVTDYLRDAAFTMLNRVVALKMLEARELVKECVTRGDQSTGYAEFCGLAPGVTQLDKRDGAGYRLYLESVFDELSTEVKVLFDRRDPASALWPKRQTFDAVREAFGTTDLARVWNEDETIGWVYQYFNTTEDRREMREAQAPRSSHELAVRNQFFTPRYVVDFLTQNTLGALWREMIGDGSRIGERCPYLVPATGVRRLPKDPRDLRILDPACGSGHFLLAVFDLLLPIYEEAWNVAATPPSTATGRTLREDYTDLQELRRHAPALILGHNLWGIDIDPRCAQIAALALWMRSQRAFREVGSTSGPQIRRTNIVVAESLPRGDDREQLLQDLDPTVAKVVRAVFERMEFAGEAGSLLDLDEVLRPPVRDQSAAEDMFAVIDAARWREIEAAAYTALGRFAAFAQRAGQQSRGLFVDDIAHGFAFIAAARQTYDVVLMNPPFGDSTARARTVCGDEMRVASSDIGGAFVLAARRRWAPDGCIGVLSSTALWFKPTVADWRCEALLSAGNAIRVAAHLGGGVLDGATVSASATVIDRMPDAAQALFIRVLFEADKASSLLESTSALRAGHHDDRVFRVPPAALSKFPGAPLAYWISNGLRSRLASFPTLEGNGAEVRQGVETPYDPRFVVAWWEVPVEDIGLGKTWVPFAKTSEYSPLWDDLTWVIRWANDGREVWAFERAHPAPPARHARGGPSTSYFGRPGVTYPGRSVLGFNPRAFPMSAAFGHTAAVAFPIDGDARVLLGYLASRPLEYVLSFSNGALQGKKGAYPNHYEVGQIKALPWPAWRSASLSALREAGDALATSALRLQVDDETTHQYAGRPGLCAHVSVRAAIESSIRHRVDLVEEIRRVRGRIDEVVASELGFDGLDVDEMNREFARCESPAVGPWSPTSSVISDVVVRAEAENLASELVGFALGRFDVRPACAVDAPTDRRSAFDAVPAGSPVLLTACPASYPIPIPGDGILALDEGSEHDLGRAVSRVAATLWGARSTQMEEELATLLGFEDLSGYFTATSQRGFFGRHVKQYAKSRRSAPVYWSLGTPSGRYSVLLHYPKLRRDSLFSLLHDYLEPKIAHEARTLASLESELGESPGAAQRRALAAKRELATELRAFADEVRSIAPLWNPSLHDGVVINSAPLWRLAPHQKAWQKDLKAAWDELCAGECDWAHLAMHLWPERVVPKCAIDRSLAIIHGLEDVFWVEREGKWSPRPAPLPIEELVKKRSSAAVKAALNTLADSPAASSRGRSSKRGRAPGDRESNR